MRTTIVLLLVSFALVNSTVSAQVLSVDHPTFGVGALTRDTVQGLDFLDLTFSLNRSFDDVSGEFGVGGDFEGFRYATEAEVLNLVNNFGFSPAAAPGVVTNGVPGDQLSELVTLLEPTSVFFPFRVAAGLTGTILPPDSPGAQPLIRSVNVNDDTRTFPNIADSVNASITTEPDQFISGSGSYLVAVVPEPGSVTLCAIMCGMGLMGRRRR